MNSILARISRVYRVLRRTHNVTVVPPFVAVLFGFLRAGVAAGMALDHVFFPRLRTRARTARSSSSATRAPGPLSSSGFWSTRGSARGWSSS